MFATLIATLGGVLSNIWAGWEKGDRYSGGVATGVFTTLATGSVTLGFAMALGFIGWRLVGWQKALDMGRNPGEIDAPSHRFEIIRDHAVMFAIAMIPAVVLAVASQTLWGLLLAPAITASYSAGMWLVPYNGKYDNIRWAEGLSGASFILVPYLVH